MNRNYKKMKSWVLSIACISVITGASLLSGCAEKQENISVNTGIGKNIDAANENTQDKVMEDFNILLKNNAKSDAVIAFIDKNITVVSRENATTFVTSLEEIQKKNLPDLEKKYNDSEKIQIEMGKVYTPQFDLSKIDTIQNTDLQSILVETRESGYKVETAEGTYFPVMNYESYKRYSSYVTSDIKDYINIMAVESNNTPAKDAALIIGWDEIIRRALSQEQFIKIYGSSPKVADIKTLQNKYLTFMLFGANNTPLFDYESKTINSTAKEVYLNAIKNNSESPLMQTLKKYMEMLAKANYKLSDSAEQFRKDALKTI
jgi:hypothetical protein